MNNLRSYAPSVLRIGISFIMLWFGLQQGLHPAMWTGFLPGFVKLFPFSPITFIYLNSWFEIIAGLLLLFGLFIRTVSLLLTLHLLGIVFTLGYNAVAVRDLGLFIALFSIFLFGADNYSLDWKLDKQP